MASPLGHALVGVVSYSAVRSGERWRLLEALACGFLAASPDLDMVVSAALTGKAGTFHRGLTHQPVFALLSFLVALVVGFVFKRKITAGVFLRSAFIASLIFSHHVLDQRIRLPYPPNSWTAESTLTEVVSAELQEDNAPKYLIDLVAYGVVYPLLAFPAVLIVRKMRSRLRCIAR